MKKFNPVRFAPRAAWLASLALLCLSVAPHARADSIMLLSDTSMVRGASTADLSFAAPSAGTVTATLENGAWPTPNSLASLGFIANSASGVLASWSGDTTNSESFQVGAGTYFAHVLAQAGPTLDVGTYTLLLSFVPAGGTVPLPASEWLLVVGVLALLGFMRVLGAFGPLEGLRNARTAEG